MICDIQLLKQSISAKLNGPVHYVDHEQSKGRKCLSDLLQFVMSNHYRKKYLCHLLKLEACNDMFKGDF